MSHQYKSLFVLICKQVNLMNLKLVSRFPFYKHMQYTYYSKFIQVCACQNVSN